MCFVTGPLEQFLFYQEMYEKLLVLAQHCYLRDRAGRSAVSLGAQRQFHRLECFHFP
jgi:hypothetical protein